MRLRQIGRPACSQIHPEEYNRHDPAIRDRPRPTAPTVPRRRRQESIVTIDGVDGSVGSATFPFKRGCPFALPEEYTQLRDEGVVPLMPLAAGGHAWIVTRYEDVRSAHPGPTPGSRRRYVFCRTSTTSCSRTATAAASCPSLTARTCSRAMASCPDRSSSTAWWPTPGGPAAGGSPQRRSGH